MWIDTIEPRDNVYDDTEDCVTRVPYMEVNEFDPTHVSHIRCRDREQTRLIYTWLRQTDTKMPVWITGNVVSYRS